MAGYFVSSFGRRIRGGAPVWTVLLYMAELIVMAGVEEDEMCREWQEKKAAMQACEDRISDAAQIAKL